MVQIVKYGNKVTAHTFAKSMVRSQMCRRSTKARVCNLQGERFGVQHTRESVAETKSDTLSVRRIRK